MESPKLTAFRADVCHSILCPGPPVFELDPRWLSEIESLAILDSLPEPREYQDLGVSFTKLTLSTRMIETIKTIRHIIIYEELVFRGILASRRFDNDMIIVAENSLLSVTYTEPLTTLQECVCLGLILYTVACLRRFANFSHTRSPISRLMSLLTTPGVIESFSVDKKDLLIWLLWIGYYASKQGHSDYSRWYFEKLRGVAESFGIYSPKELQGVLGKFLYTARTCGSLEGLYSTLL